jgi:hypothetical protein
MVLVALVGVAAWGWRLWELREDYQRKADVHRFMHAFAYVETHMLPCESNPNPVDPATVARFERLMPYHFAMMKKYERAVRYPWLWVEPDRPEPE